MTIVERRTLLIGTGALAAAAVGGVRVMGVSEVASVTTFKDLAHRPVPLAVDTVHTQGFANPGWGGATYRVDHDLNADYCRRNPFTAVMVPDGRVFRLWEPQRVRPSQFGAAVVPKQDDTAMLRAFFAYRTERLEGDPGAVYTVRPTAPDQVILPIERGIVSDGHGATIRLADGAGEWTALIGNLDVRVDLSGLSLRNWIFDGNVAASPPPEIMGGLLRRPRHFLCIRRGTGFRMQRCIVRNFVSTNAVLFSGDGATGDGSVEDCVFEAVGNAPGHAYHDHSTVYLTGDNIHVRHCVLRASGWGAAGAVCAIELHPGHGYSVQACRIEGFHTGINIAGVYETASTDGIVADTRINVLRRGIAIYSGAYRDHQRGFGIDGLRIDTTAITLRNDMPQGRMSGGGVGLFGIGVMAGATLAVRNLIIGGSNTVTFDIETRRPDWQGIPAGVGLFEDNADAVFENIDIGTMTITNAPAIGVVIGFGRGIFKNIKVNPKIVNCGGGRADQVNDLHRTAVFLSTTRVEDDIVLNPQVVDNGSQRRIVNTFVIGARQRTNARVVLGGSIILSAGVNGYGFTIFRLDETIVPLVRFSQNFGYYEQPGMIARPGSFILNTRTGTRQDLARN